MARPIRIIDKKRQVKTNTGFGTETGISRTKGNVTPSISVVIGVRKKFLLDLIA
jgi:hypothetical protein